MLCFFPRPSLSFPSILSWELPGLGGTVLDLLISFLRLLLLDTEDPKLREEEHSLRPDWSWSSTVEVLGMLGVGRGEVSTHARARQVEA